MQTSRRARANGPIEGIFVLILSLVVTIGLAVLVGGAVAQGFARVGAQLTLAQAPAIGGAR
jgi:hypothetical protein